ncbi:hypothetical protein DsansV1_C04g0038461 [Dioscorea sansibarensis]
MTMVVAMTMMRTNVAAIAETMITGRPTCVDPLSDFLATELYIPSRLPTELNFVYTIKATNRVVNLHDLQAIQDSVSCLWSALTGPANTHVQ